MSRQIEIMKSEGQYYEAGRQAALTGGLRVYGCHYGMRSSRDGAMEAFYRGYDEAHDVAPITEPAKYGL